MNQRWHMTEQGLVCEGTLEVQILYVTSSDRQPLGNMAVSLPYSQMIEIPEIDKKDRIYVMQKLDQLAVSMSNSGQIEIRGTAGAEVCVMEQCSLQNIKEISVEDYDMELYKKRPGMCIHFVQPGETLWKIAKNHYTTTEEIKKLNELSCDEVAAGQKLLLLKAAATPLVL